MLLNASHEITFSGLPPDLLDAYVRYKKGTRALVAWFIQYSPTPTRRAKSLPIKELEHLAQSVRKSLRSLPDVVHFHFRETIAARKRLSKYYRDQFDGFNDDEDTINHEHFTTSLASIYADLCACCGGPGTRCPQSRQRASATCPSDSPINHYHGLTVEEAEELEDNAEAVPSSCPECEPQARSSSDTEDLQVHFVDDDLGNLIEVAAAVQRIQEIASAVEATWTAVGSGNLSYPSGSFITNVAFASLRQIGIELLQHDESLSLSRLERICGSFRQSGGVAGAGQAPNCSLLNHLQQIEQNLFHYRDCGSFLAAGLCAACIQKPAEYLQSDTTMQGSPGDPRLSPAILENIVHLVTSKEIPTSIVRNGSPVYADVGYLITHPNEQTQSWSSVLGLSLLTQSYGVFLRSLPCPGAVSQCRISGLKLAQHTSSQIAGILENKTCFPCRCTQTMAYQLQTLEGELRGYASYKCWDLYFQSPWVVGNHVLEMLDLCHTYGRRLLNYGHYVGAVLHSYNVLKQLGGLEPIRILDQICDLFMGVLFPGGRPPTGSFRACWARYAGARLKFKKGHRGKHSQDFCTLTIPTGAAKRAAGMGHDAKREKSECPLFEIKHQDYHLSDEQWSSLSIVPETPKSGKTRRKGSTASAKLDQARREQRFSDLAEVVQQCFSGHESNTLPVARLNLFAIFDKCIRVISRLSDETHTKPDEKGINCICFCSAIITAADRIVDSRRLGKLETWKEHERDCVKQTNDAIRDTFAGLKEDELLWAI